MWAIGLHGGVGPRREEDAAGDIAVFEAILDAAGKALTDGAAALDVVESAVRAMEDCGRFVAGKGSRPNTAGGYELDASICDGATRKAGSVAALAGAYPPISIARAVMEKTDHVLLVGNGALKFAIEEGFAPVDDPARFFVHDDGAAPDARTHGTVGAVVLDAGGRIAAGTSTGGTLGKRPGRVGDSPIVGAGSWADGISGVSCMGHGEYFLRAAAAHSVAMRCGEGGLDLQTALDRTIDDVGALGGDGGIVAVHRNGSVRYAFNSRSMRVARADSAGLREAMIAKRGG
jgi:beta-aspartyl-peptidase (threonine type)